MESTERKARANRESRVLFAKSGPLRPCRSWGAGGKDRSGGQALFSMGMKLPPGRGLLPSRLGPRRVKALSRVTFITKSKMPRGPRTSAVAPVRAAREPPLVLALEVLDVTSAPGFSPVPGSQPETPGARKAATDWGQAGNLETSVANKPPRTEAARRGQSESFSDGGVERQPDAEASTSKKCIFLAKHIF